MTIFGYTINIEKVKTQKKTSGFSAKRWTSAEKNTLLRFHSEGMPIKDIAKELSRTVPSIHSMLNKLHKGKK